MPRGIALLKDTLTYGLGNFGSRLIGLLLLPFYTAVFSKQDFGYIDLITMGSMLFILVASLKLLDGAYRFLWEAKTADEKTRVISSALNFVFINFLLLSALCWVVIQLTGFELLYGGLIFLWLLIRIPSEFFQQAARAIGKNHIYSISGIILATSMLFFNVALLGYYDFGVAGYLWAMVISYLFSLIYCVIAGSGAAYYRPTVLSFAALRPLLKYSLPLLPAAVSWWLIKGSGRYVLSHVHGLDAVGIFAVADKLPTALYLLGVTFYMAWQDGVLKHFNEPGRNEFLNRAIGSYVRAGLSIVILTVVLLKPFFAVMVDESYHEAHVYVPWLLLSVFLLCLGGLYEVFFLRLKKTVGILWSTIVAAMVSIVLNILFVPAFGLWATTLATLLAGAAHLAVRIYQLGDSVRINFNWKEILALLAVMAIAVTCYELRGWAYCAGALGVSALLMVLNVSDIRFLAAIARSRLKRA